MNIEQARFNMVEQQIRPWNVLDQRVLDLLSDTPRERFVPPSYSQLAFSDTCIPIGHDQTMMTPKVEARLMQALAVQPGEEALEIGTGSGYVTALLAKSCRHVVSFEWFDELSAMADRSLQEAGLKNVSLEVGDGIEASTGGSPYDVIAVTGSMFQLGDGLRAQLRVGGRLFVITGEHPVMDARVIVRVAESEWSDESLFETSLAPLFGAGPPNRFVL
jgi:protein-L-isoaspartate(D-aspartate) O-methyltransferase